MIRKGFKYVGGDVDTCRGMLLGDLRLELITKESKLVMKGC